VASFQAWLGTLATGTIIGIVRLSTGIGNRAISAKRMDAKMAMKMMEEEFIFILVNRLAFGDAQR
jgi:uncharacterized membrane protein